MSHPSRSRQFGWWVSCSLFTVRVVTDEKGEIVTAAPIIKKFLGQPISNLENWIKSRVGGEMKMEFLGEV